MPEHTSAGRLPHLLVTPPQEVLDEITSRNTSLNKLLEDASLMLMQMNGEESGVARMFTERGYSDAFANWIPQEAKARSESMDTGTAGAD